MRKIFLILAVTCLLSSSAWAMYGDSDQPAEDYEKYTYDKEDPPEIQKPELQAGMPEAQKGIMFDEVDNPEEEYIEKNITEDEVKPQEWEP